MSNVRELDVIALWLAEFAPMMPEPIRAAWAEDLAHRLEGARRLNVAWRCICGSGDDAELHSLMCVGSNTPDEVWEEKPS